MECRFFQEIEYGILHAEPEEEDKERIQSPRENQIEEGIADKASLHGKVLQIQSIKNIKRRDLFSSRQFQSHIEKRKRRYHEVEQKNTEKKSEENP